MSTDSNSRQQHGEVSGVVTYNLLVRNGGREMEGRGTVLQVATVDHCSRIPPTGSCPRPSNVLERVQCLGPSHLSSWQRLQSLGYSR